MTKKTTATKKQQKKKVTKKDDNIVNEPMVKQEEVLTEVQEETPSVEDDEKLHDEVLKQVANDILADNDNSVSKMMDMPREEIVEKAKEKIDDFKKNNKETAKRVDNMFGYLWNGQEIDY